MKLISTTQIETLISMHEAIDAMGSIFAELSAGKCQMPVRTVNNFGGMLLLTKPAWSPERQYAGLKILTQVDTNADRGLPLLQGLVFLIDSSDGRFLAMMDGKYITALRTGAASGLATRLLARPDAAVAAIFGAGVQGATQLEAVCAVRPIVKAYVFDVNAAAAADYACRLGDKLGISVLPAPSLAVLKEADVICTATGAVSPLFRADHLKAGVHINAIGSFRPHMQELPGEWVASADVFVDQLESCLAETGDLLIPLAAGLFGPEHIRGEIGQLVQDRPAGRPWSGRPTLFKSVGLAVQDLAIAALVHERALAAGLGCELEL